VERPFPAYKGDEPYVFVSYAHDDAAAVYPEITRLKDQGFNIWYDEGISPGASWRDELALALTGCSAFLFYVTPRSVASGNCQREVNFCLSRERKILCVHLEETRLPIGLELSLSDTQAIMRAEHSDDDYRVKLADALRAMLHLPMQTAPLPRAPVVDESDDISIAIFPLVNRSNDPENEYLGDGIAEELINGLAHLDGLRVASQMSTFAYKGRQADIVEIGRRLRVQHALSGSVQKSGNRVRINIRLDRTGDGTTLWSQRYDRVLEDIFELQDEIAKQVIDALDVELRQSHATKLVDVGTDNLEAYNEYLLGRNEIRRATHRSWVRALEHFRKATELDDDFGAAHMGIVVCCANLNSRASSPTTDLLAAGAHALERARQLGHRPDQPWIKYRLMFGLEERPDFRRWVQLVCEKIRDPGPDWRGTEYWELVLCLVSADLNHGALQFIEGYPEQVLMPRLFGLGPRIKGLCLANLGRFERAIDAIKQFLDTQPDPIVRGDLALMYSRTGQFDKAEQELRELSTVWLTNFPQFHHLYWSGDLEEARAYFQRTNFLNDIKVPGLIMLEQYDEAVDCLEEMIDNDPHLARDAYWTYRYLCPTSIIEEIDSHPRFIAALARMGIDDAMCEELIESVNALEDVTGIRIQRDPPRT